MSKHSLLLWPTLLSLAACATPTASPMGGQCNADAASSYVGRTADAATVEAARKASGAENARTLKPGQMVTMEYLEGRLNVYLDANDRIERIDCG